MTRNSGRAAWALALVLVAGSFFGELNKNEKRGQEIYFHGTADGKEIPALLDNGQTRVNASILPCAGCHGLDGRGKTEGGIAAPDITWNTLTKPYAVTRPDGRSRRPYTESTLKRAVVMGLDPGGGPLQPAMPRFQLSYNDGNDLVAFLKQLGQTADPGISDTSIRIGVLLPQPELLPQLHDGIVKSVTAYFNDINNGGGIYGRRIELKFFDLPSSSQQSPAAVRAWLERESIFALTGSFLAKEESSLAPVLKETGTPLICAFVLDPDTGSGPVNPYVFYLDAGLRGEVEELARTAEKLFPHGARVAIAEPDYEVTHKLAGYLRNRLSAPEWSISTIAPDADGCRKAARTQIIFWLSPQFSPATLRECSDALDGQTTFLVPGSFASPGLLELPNEMDHKVFVTLPSPIPDKEAGNGSGAKDQATPWPNREAELPAIASARLLTWALQHAGRDLSRHSLVEALEGAYHLDLGSGISVSYGPNRRIGGSGQTVYAISSHHLEPVNMDSP